LESGEVHSAGQPEMRRKLAVILASDVAGYSRLVAADEEDTVRRFRQAASAFGERVQRYRGRVFNTAGDAILAEFESAVDATRCAVDIQDANKAHNTEIDPARKLLFRIGIAIGDVLVCDNGDLLGDGVNIAARLEGVAEPGGICVSEDVKIHAMNKISAGFVDLGERQLKNIPRGIRAYRLGTAAAKTALPVAKSPRSLAARLRVGGAIAAAGLLAVAGAAFVVPRLSPPPPTAVSPSVALSPPAAVSPQAVSPAAVAGGDHPFDPANVPLVTDRVRSSLVDYVRQPDFKAVAISHIGWGVASGLPDAVSAERDAIDRCKRRDANGDCRIYAVGDKVVWPKSPVPLAADFHPEPLDIPLPADLAIVQGAPKTAGPAGLDAFLKAKNHKALAVSDTGSSSGFSANSDRPDQAEAIRLAVERCSDFAKSPCLLISVDGFLTVRIPRSHGIVRPYTLAGETEMSEADKARIGQIYTGKDWRALAKGRSGRWYAVNAAESEMAAADRVLQDCRQAETECQLRAIGNFRIDRR
jgi:class 3 adenylate cyclase